MGRPSADSLHRGRLTPERLTRSNTSSSCRSKSSRNSFMIAAHSVAGAFVTCFTHPAPGTKTAKSVADSRKFRPPSEADSGGSKRGSGGSKRGSGGSKHDSGGSKRGSGGSERGNGGSKHGSGDSKHGSGDSKRGSKHGSGGSNRGIYANSNNSIQGRVSGSLKFTMEEICTATGNFSPMLIIGQGGFGTVYKGRLKDGTLVAVKRATKSVHSNHVGLEFQRETQILAQVDHLNLVKFYGFLVHEDEKIVVVEYVPNGTLRGHLDCLHGNVLDLAARIDIAIDVAHAVTYLHLYTDHPIIHRDIKSSNILLSENLRAKVADFGFARVGADGESGITHVFTQVKGTAGYLDPDYLKTFQLTDKTDVYSFGVLLVELITGRRPIEPKHEQNERITAKWAVKKFTEGEAISTLDPLLEKTAANNLAIEKIYELALGCLNPCRQNRPNMRMCAKILWSIRKDYREVLSASDIHSLSSQSQFMRRNNSVSRQ